MLPLRSGLVGPWSSQNLCSGEACRSLRASRATRGLSPSKSASKTASNSTTRRCGSATPRPTRNEARRARTPIVSLIGDHATYHKRLIRRWSPTSPPSPAHSTAQSARRGSPSRSVPAPRRRWQKRRQHPGASPPSSCPRTCPGRRPRRWRPRCRRHRSVSFPGSGLSGSPPWPAGARRFRTSHASSRFWRSSSLANRSLSASCRRRRCPGWATHDLPSTTDRLCAPGNRYWYCRSGASGSSLSSFK